MDWGMENRLAQVIPSDGRCLFMPIDHGYFQGPTRSLESPWQTLEPLLPYSDAVFVTRGVLRSAIPAAKSKPIVLRVSGGTSMVGNDLANEGITTPMEEAIRLNASAVGISVFIGSEYEKENLLNLASLVSEGERYGIPVMAVTAVGRELEKRDARYLGLCCRIAAELGAKVVKTYWCEEFEKVVEGCPVPVIMAGGPQVDTELEVLEFVDAARPVRLEQAGQRAVGEQLAAGLAGGAVVALVGGVPDALHRRAARRARLAVLAVHGHLGVERGHLLRELLAALGAQQLHPLGEHRHAGTS